MNKENNTNKPIIETLINTSALALTSYAVLQITTNNMVWYGYAALVIGIGLEFVKYWGRKKQYW